MRLLHKMPEARPVSAEVVVKELRAIERELLADRQTADIAAAAPPMAVAAVANEAPGESVALTNPKQPASTPQFRRHKLVIAAAVLAALAATAVGSFVFAPNRRSKVGITAVGPTSTPAHNQGAVATMMPPAPGPARTAQVVANRDQLSPPIVRGAVSEPSLLAGTDAPRSKATTERGLPHVAKDPQHEEQAAEKVAPSERKMRSEMPTVSITEEGRAPEGGGLSARENGPWDDAVDPDGDCKFVLAPREGRVRIIVPGKPHILSAEIGRVNAPRLLRNIKGDFDVIVRVAGTGQPGGKATTTLYPPYHGAGLLIWQDQENYVRLEIATDLRHGKPRPYVNFEHRKNGALATSSGILNKDGSNHLRLRRHADEIYASFGPDGLRWTSFAPLTAKLDDRLKVGVSAINSSTKPLTAEFEGLETVERPGAGGDLKTGTLHP
jgi:regulation of enolase protein 1 (concanavalin A-like superfamily)